MATTTIFRAGLAAAAACCASPRIDNRAVESSGDAARDCAPLGSRSPTADHTTRRRRWQGLSRRSGVVINLGLGSALALAALGFISASARAQLLADDAGAIAQPEGRAGLEDLPAFAPDRLVVNLDPVAAVLARVADIEHTLSSGSKSLDAVAAAIGVRSARRQYPGREPGQGHLPGELAGWFVIEFDSARATIEQAIALYAADPAVLDVQPVGLHRISLIPNDPFYAPDQWHLNQPGGPDINAPQAWDTHTGDPVIIAVLDSGVRYFHKDLGGSAASLANPMATDGNVWRNQLEHSGAPGVDDDSNGFLDDWVGWDFISSPISTCAAGEDCIAADNDPRAFNGHGTHCAGTAAAINNNGYSCASPAGGFGDGTLQPAADGSRVMCLRVGHETSSGSGVASMDAVAAALVYAADNGARIASCSFETSNTGGLGAAADAFTAAGGLIVSAAGNDNSSSPEYLCTRSDVICVAATDPDDLKASFSNYGAHIDIAAPGVDITSLFHESTDPANDYVNSLSGTSMACPLVAGGAALVWSANPAWTAADVRQQLESTADDIEALNPAYAGLLGSGRLNLQAALGPPDKLAACCLGSTCTELTLADCDLQGGTWTPASSCFASSTAVGDPVPNLAIPDNSAAGISHQLVVAADETILDLDLALSISHTWVGDLVVTLGRSGGPTVTVINRPGLPAIDPVFGCSAANYIGIELDDQATGGPIEDQCTFNLASPPGYTPNNPLSAFAGISTQGTWTLTVSDNAAGDVGTLDAWSLAFTSADEAVCAEPLGACCLGSGCEQLTATECGDQGGAYLGDGVLCEAVSYTDDPEPNIVGPDGGAFSRTLTVDDSFIIGDLNIPMQIAHLVYGDLLLQLTHTPADPEVMPKTVTLLSGDSTDNSNLVSGGEYRFDAEAPLSFNQAAINTIGSAGNIPFGDYQPDGLLSSNALTQLYGRNAEGTWTLDVIDLATTVGSGSATLHDWTLEFTSTIDPCDDPCSNDTTPPDVLCSNIPYLEVVEPDGCTISLSSAPMDDATASDDCTATADIVLMQDPPPGTLLGLGEHTVTVTASDAAGNSASCFATVEVVDQTPPTVTCSDANVSLDANGMVTLTASDLSASAFDNCTFDTPVFIDPETFDCDDVGTHVTVTVSATDAAGNPGTCTAQVTITAPPPTVTCTDATVTLGGNGTVTVTDNDVLGIQTSACGVESITIKPDTFDCSDAGTTQTVTVTVMDEFGQAGQCTAQVTIVAGDGDGDGHAVCEDCDDGDPAIHPGAAEECDDGVDNDCDGTVDEPVDADGDGHASAACAGGTDCDDGDPAIHPGASEDCDDGVDNDCDGMIDEPVDADGDGHVSAVCAGGTDCDDGDPAVHPGAAEDCDDGTDNDCDGTVDAPVDADGDGHASAACAGGTDCDDTDPAIHPGASEVPYDGIDQDCDGEDLCDVDGDGHDSTACTDGEDCDDGDPAVHPAAAEQCNDTDDDCDGEVDEDTLDTDSDAQCDALDPDDDNDGVLDGDDRAPTDPGSCGDSDGDSCDDCSAGGVFDPSNDGTDTDSDGLCDDGDPDDDGDGLLDGDDPCPTDPLNECGKACDDGDPCTIDEVIKGDCTHTPIDCDDGDPCTVDSCDPKTGECFNTPIVCDDNNPCTNDACVDGVCVFTPVDCDDGDPCTIDSCDPKTGECIHECETDAPEITCPPDVTVSCIEDAAPGLPFGSVDGVVGIYYNDNGMGEVPINQAYLRSQYSDVNSNGGQFTFSSIPLTGNGLTWSAIFNELGQYGFDLVLPVNPDGSVVPPVLTAVDNADNTPGGAIAAGPVAWAINDYKDDAPNGPGNTNNAPTNSVIRGDTPPIAGDIVITRNDVTESGGVFTAEIEGYLVSDGVIHWYTIGQPDSPMANFNLTGTFYFAGTLTYDVAADTYPIIDFYEGTIEVTANAPGSEVGFATATDDCTPFPLIAFTDAVSGGTGCAGDPMIITRTWTATDDCGNVGSCDQIITVEDDELPVFLSVPGDVEVTLEAGECSAVVEIGQPLVTDNCGAPLLDPPTVTFVRSDSAPGIDDPYLPGVTTITWTATDACGNELTALTTVTVDAVDELDITVELANVSSGAFTRCIRIELFDCEGGEAHVIEQAMTFSGGMASAKLEIPCAPRGWDCATVRDPLHTLRSTVNALSISDQQYVVSFTGADALIGGNLNGPSSNVIDIFDFGAFAGEFNEVYSSGNTDCDDLPPHADLDGDAFVFVSDYTFITNNFLAFSDPDCCAAGVVDGGGGIAGGDEEAPVLAITVAELEAMGLGHMAAGDLNNDGWLDPVDMQLFAQGVWPSDEDEVREVAFIGSSGGSWFDAANWSDGLLPDANTNVTIDVNVHLEGGEAFAADIAINSGAMLSVADAALSAQSVTISGGSMLTLDDPSTFLSAKTLTLHEGAMLAWNAGIIAADVISSGAIDVGQPVAQLILDGEFTQLPPGVLHIDIAGDLNSMHDALIITGPAQLGGTLHVNLLDDYVPAIDVKITAVIEAQLITGQFAQVIPPVLPSGMFQHLAISETALNIIYSDQPLLPADLNADGIIGAADLAELLAQWGACNPPPGTCSADFNADGTIDAADLAQTLSAWSTTSGAGSG